MGKKWKDKYASQDAQNAQDESGSAVEEAAAPAAQEPKVDFDGWYGARQKLIPPQHHKEILKADFKARKVPVMATMAQFDHALKMYGVKLA